ncbi:MAG: GntR family transcriptional regulator [Fimbriimonadaceae bacterium]|nr:GntR family transcriptional regulator [Fimbriimonadaceae bacterium]
MNRSRLTDSSRNGYHEVAAALRRDIRDGKIGSGSLLPTERELQDRFTTSRTTVRRALQSLVDSGWAEASPNRGVLAKQGRPQASTTNIAFIDHAETVNQPLFMALNKRLQDVGYHLVHVDSHRFTVEGAITYAHAQGFAGAIIWPKTSYLHLPQVQSALALMPVVNIRHSFPNAATDVVSEDGFDGGHLVASHLARMGSRRVAVTGMLDMLSTNHERFAGYQIGLMDNEIQPSSADYVFCFTSDMVQPDTRLLEFRLSQPDRPDAVFVLDDFLVPFVAKAIERCGLRVPEDVRVVAFGNDVPYDFGGVGLTTILVDWELVADAAVRRLVARLHGDHSAHKKVKIPVRLVVRGSCGASPATWENIPYFSHANSFAYALPEHGRRPYVPGEAVLATSAIPTKEG